MRAIHPGGRERGRERETEGGEREERGEKREGERERVRVCVREREAGTGRTGGHTFIKKRKAILDRFIQGKLLYLINVRVFIERFNASV